MFVLINLIHNIFTTLAYNVYSLIMTIITGKIPKVSAYHFDKTDYGNNVINICNDKNIKCDNVNYVSDKVKKKIISDFIHELSKDDKFNIPTSKINYPIFNGEKIIGHASWYSIVDTILNEKYKDN